MRTDQKCLLTRVQLLQIFAGYRPISAQAVLRPIPRFMVKRLKARNEARKGRGFGFVTLGSEALQQQAVREMDGRTVQGRQIDVKVAIDKPYEEDGVVEVQAENQVKTENQVQARDLHLAEVQIDVENQSQAETLSRVNNEALVEKQVGSNTACDMPYTVSEQMVDRALLKIEQWCDSWLSGHVPETDWYTFKDCLD